VLPLLPALAFPPFPFPFSRTPELGPDLIPVVNIVNIAPISLIERKALPGAETILLIFKHFDLTTFKYLNVLNGIVYFS
jgi:hypothetical protein